jgi:hypothetical protein
MLHEWFSSPVLVRLVSPTLEPARSHNPRDASGVVVVSGALLRLYHYLHVKFSSFTLPILDVPQVAITLVYRYQPPARVPIDAGNLVADNRNPLVYRHLKELYILNERFI